MGRHVGSRTRPTPPLSVKGLFFSSVVPMCPFLIRYILIFKKGRLNSSERWTYGNVDIPVVVKFKYLSLWKRIETKMAWIWNHEIVRQQSENLMWWLQWTIQWLSSTSLKNHDTTCMILHQVWPRKSRFIWSQWCQLLIRKLFQIFLLTLQNWSLIQHLQWRFITKQNQH